MHYYRKWCSLERQYFSHNEVIYDHNHEYGSREMSDTLGCAYVLKVIRKGIERELLRVTRRVDAGVYI